MKPLSIINGPNLNFLGKRETTIYGNQTFDEFLKAYKKKEPNITIDYFQSNIEGELINYLQNNDEKFLGFVINAGALTHTSIALRDGIASIKTPVIEVHISNIYKREAFRQKSFLASQCLGVITGFGFDSYCLALDFFIKNYAHLPLDPSQ